jgi:hypothetical protein
MKRRLENLGFWFAGIYLALVAFAAVFPGDAWYPFGAFIKMIPGTLLWPFVVLLERAGADTTPALIVLYALFGPLCFWALGKIVSLIARKLLPHAHEKG